MALVYLGLLALFLASSGYSMTKNERVELRETVKDMFRHAYDSYMTHAYPADELMPLTCKGRYRDIEPSRGDVDDILGNFSMTLIDSLDSLVIFGEINQFEEAVRLVIDEVDFDNDIVVSTFETNIRVLGGLLGGHVAANVLRNKGQAMDWYNDELLDMAKDIGERLMPAFNTTTGIPYPKVNLRYGVVDPRSRTGTESATCTACAGTMIMEFGALSRLTGDSKFETVAHKAMKALWTYRSRSSDLVGTVINIHNGEWVRRDSGVGAGIDSYYEYCLKAYILLGEEDYLQRFNQHYKAVMRYINKDSLFLNVHMNNPSRRSVAYMDSLQAFWPGLQVLKGDLQSAIELHEVFYSVAKRHTFLPEAFTTNFEVHWGQHFLRPELVESTYFLYEATRDPYYLDVGKYIVENLNKYTRVPCGFAAVKDVRTLSHENRMDSFLLSETLKYLYLLFTEKEDIPINLQDFVFTTEAHILPLTLSNWNASSSQSNVYESENLHDHSCPRTAGDGSLLSFAEKIRRKSRQSGVDGSCPKKKGEKATVAKSKSGTSLLRAEQFIPGNKDHLLILKAMGITVTKTDDGKVQLMQDANSADNAEMAGEGVTFMQSMIELAKFRSNDAEYLPRVVQILSPPYNGNIVLNAGPAQFGIDLGKSGMGVSAEVILADPFKGCTELNNKEVADHRIVVMERGDCMFVDKVRVAASFGAVGAIIIDNNEGSSSESQPLFAMSGDGSSGDIDIPAVFLFFNEGQVLQKSMQIVDINAGGNLRVRLADKALKKDAKAEKSVPALEPARNARQDQTTAEVNSRAENERVQSEKIGHVGDEVDKLINLMRNVVKQPGFEFLTKNTQLNGKASVMTGETNTADRRERWLYDVMMENWREKAASQSGSVDEVRKEDIVTVETKTEPGGDCKAGESSRLFMNTVKRGDSEVIFVGKVCDGKSEETAYDVTTLRQLDDGGSLDHEESQDETRKDEISNPSESNDDEDSDLMKEDNQNDGHVSLSGTGSHGDSARHHGSIQDEVDEYGEGLQEAKRNEEEESDRVELKRDKENKEMRNKNEACKSKECQEIVDKVFVKNERSVRDELDSESTIESAQLVDERTFDEESTEDSTNNSDSGSSDVFSNEKKDSSRHEELSAELKSETSKQKSIDHEMLEQKGSGNTESSQARTVEEIGSQEMESDFTRDSGEKQKQKHSERTSGESQDAVGHQ